MQYRMQRLHDITGHKLDTFQSNCLRVIESNYDLLALASTGSGKTVVALTAIILNAFDKGHRAIMTTPIKALSNQKFAEFQSWLTKIGYPNRITLLTGDIQARATVPGGDGQPELLIMTSEILANKLDSCQRTGTIDKDLENVSVLVIDEAHYITDIDRGHVWERTIMYLPPSIQIVALSATLSEPERFQEWLSTRRPTQLVQHIDRHVPLHFGFYDSKGFVELFSTKNETKVMDSSVYKRLTPQNGTFAQSINKIVKILDKDQKLPAIIFSMSKVKCEEAAFSLSQNFLYGSPPVMGKDDDPLAFGEIQSEHQYNVKCVRNRQDSLFQKHLRPYHELLNKLPRFDAFKSLLDKGIAYHHAGMIPILREYVEILFSEKLLKVVFATETLAIGINMPAKCVVFTSLDKPSGEGDMVSLKPEQFMQMSGRAGRRGMDDKGYVVYYPLRNCVSDADFRHLLFGKMQSAVSRLNIIPLFVLKNLKTSSILEKTLLHHQQESYIKSMSVQLDKIPQVEDDVLQKVEIYLELKDKLQPGLVRLSNSQRKSYEREIAELKLDESTIKVATNRIIIKKEIETSKTALRSNWEATKLWLEDYAFIETDCDGNCELSITGKVASGLSDGMPLIRGAMIASGCLNDATFEQIAGWLGCFTEYIRVLENLTTDDGNMNVLLDEIEITTQRYNNPEDSVVQYNTGLLVHRWAVNKDIHEICGYIGAGQLGTFVKSVLRVISYMEEMKTVLLGLQYYELYNKIDHHQDRLMDGIVTNRSLYVE